MISKENRERYNIIMKEEGQLYSPIRRQWVEAGMNTPIIMVQFAYDRIKGALKRKRETKNFLNKLLYSLFFQGMDDVCIQVGENIQKIVGLDDSKLSRGYEISSSTVLEIFRAEYGLFTGRKTRFNQNLENWTEIGRRKLNGDLDAILVTEEKVIGPDFFGLYVIGGQPIKFK